MMKTGMMVISNPNIVLRTLPVIQNEISNTLYIQYFPSTSWDKNLISKKVDSLKHQTNWPTFSSSITALYSQFLAYKQLDVRLLLSGIKNQQISTIITKKPIEVVYYDQLFSKDEVNKFVLSFVNNKTTNCQLVALPCCTEETLGDDSLSNEEDIYDNVVIGGTFDRLHYGHKILLTEAILRCRKKMTVGVTDAIMLQSKKLWELVEPCESRLRNVRDFLEEVDPTLEYEIVPITDMFGPTKDDPSFQMIVVSSETVGGGAKINEVRKQAGLNPLAIHSVALVTDIHREDEEEEEKISSSNLRLRCLGTLLRPPAYHLQAQKPDCPVGAYVIGLTGSIASGKSHVSAVLADLGAGVVDCDKIAHQVYLPGTPGHADVVREFGEGVLDETGAVDRKKLGAIVFSDKQRLAALNSVVWPHTLRAVQQRVQELRSAGYTVVVLEAAVLLQAAWGQHCHEIWSCIIPPSEAIRRVMERNGLSQEEACARVNAQPNNVEHVANANVVFCTLWRYEFTRKQVTKAWTALQQRLNNAKL